MEQFHLCIPLYAYLCALGFAYRFIRTPITRRGSTWNTITAEIELAFRLRYLPAFSLLTPGQCSLALSGTAPSVEFPVAKLRRDFVKMADKRELQCRFRRGMP